MEKVIFTVVYYTQSGTSKTIYVVAKDYAGAERATKKWAENAIPNQFKHIFRIEMANDTKFITDTEE